MGVLERRLRIAVPEQPADRQHRLALRHGDAGVRVTQIVKADIAQVRFRSHAIPELVDPRRSQMAIRPRRGENPHRPAGQAVEDRARGGREPDHARPSLAVRQKHLALAVETPLQGDDFALAAAGEQQQPYDRHGLRVVGFMACQHLAQPADFRGRQETHPPLTAIAPDARARVGSFLPVSVDLGLAHDD